ncbi:MAG: YqaJ viral recombinase family protein [Betaproteobacteria bacterium]|nr:YqaJ viral recombinase family protein [Betaproteobacteria bacterium]MDH4322872.1 YqaJ viral recombinase family protein [Betaproteobacteria bacterium]MDH5210548.1 YqaJ viral recombinase family protein [Betaproteobacteria bacterium]
MALTPKQLAERTRRIGGSDAAAIVGKDPYRTAWEVAMRIRGEMEADKSLEDADQILFGNEMEGVLARIYERKNKVKLVEPDTMVHEKHPFLAVNIDRRIEGNPALALEMKNTGQKFQAAGTPILESWGSPGTDQVPERVILQCQHAMMIDPLIQMFHVVRCYGGNVYQQFVVPRNASLIDALQEIELEFYKRAMEGLLPEPDWEHRSTSDALGRAFKKIQGTIESRPDLEHWTKAFEQAKAERLRIATLEDGLKNHIVHLMGNTEIALLSDGRKWQRKLVARAGYTVDSTEYIETRLVKPRTKKEE